MYSDGPGSLKSRHSVRPLLIPRLAKKTRTFQIAESILHLCEGGGQSMTTIHLGSSCEYSEARIIASPKRKRHWR